MAAKENLIHQSQPSHDAYIADGARNPKRARKLPAKDTDNSGKDLASMLLSQEESIGADILSILLPPNSSLIAEVIAFFALTNQRTSDADRQSHPAAECRVHALHFDVELNGQRNYKALLAKKTHLEIPLRRLCVLLRIEKEISDKTISDRGRGHDLYDWMLVGGKYKKLSDERIEAMISSNFALRARDLSNKERVMKASK